MPDTLIVDDANIKQIVSNHQVRMRVNDDQQERIVHDLSEMGTRITTLGEDLGGRIQKVSDTVIGMDSTLRQLILQRNGRKTGNGPVSRRDGMMLTGGAGVLGLMELARHWLFEIGGG